MTPGITRRLVVGLAVTAALTGGTALGAGPAAADVDLVPIFGSLDAGSQLPEGNIGVGAIVDSYIYTWTYCGPLALAYSSGSDVPDALANPCAPAPWSNIG